MVIVELRLGDSYLEALEASLRDSVFISTDSARDIGLRLIQSHRAAKSDLRNNQQALELVVSEIRLLVEHAAAADQLAARISKRLPEDIDASTLLAHTSVIRQDLRAIVEAAT